MSEEEQRVPTKEEIRELIRQNMPSLREVAPKEFEAMVKNGEVLAEKLSAYMQGALRGRAQREAFALVALIGEEAVIETAAVVVGVVAGEIAASKAHVARKDSGE